MPTVGILINNYNNGPWLRACVDSALSQTRPADEVIVYDDGSTDDSLAILRSYGDRIRLIEGVHDFTRSGRASQRAAMIGAFSVSTAEHLYLLDGDDAFIPSHLADYEAVWSAHPVAVMLQCPMIRVDPHGRELGPYRDAHKHCADYLATIYRSHETDRFYLCSSLAFRRDFLVRVFPLLDADGNDFTNDSTLALHAVFSGPILTLPAASVLYRVRENSLSAENNRRIDRRVYETRAGAVVFNFIAAHYGHPPIRLWRNSNYLLQLARHWLPEWLAQPFARLKAALRRRLK